MGELKVLDLEVTISDASAAGSQFISWTSFTTAAAKQGMLTGMTQGLTSSHRTGRAIRVHSLSYRLTIEAQRSEPIHDDCIRVTTIVDRQYRGSNPAGTDIFHEFGTSNSFESYRNLMNNNRFRTLDDQWVLVHPTYAYETVGSKHFAGSWITMLAKTHDFKTPLEIDYDDGNVGNDNECSGDNIFQTLQFYNGANLFFVVNGKARVRFTDA